MRGKVGMLGANREIPWNLSSAYYVQSVSVAAQETLPAGVAFKTDGTRMYVVGLSSDAVNEYSLSTAWDTSTASYQQNISVSAKFSSPYDVAFKPDGTRMYVIGNDVLADYAMSTPWDVATASYDSQINVSGVGSPISIAFRDNGSRLYILSGANGDIDEYSLSTAWDLSTASYQRNFFLTPDYEGYGIFFKPDGTRLYATVRNQSGQGPLDAVNEYSLSTAWDITSASYVRSFDVGSQETSPRKVAFKTDGSRMYVVGTSSDSVIEYQLS
jgi:DNA-binding beta-propeller fold protein YncE